MEKAYFEEIANRCLGKAQKIADTQKEDDFEADEIRALIPEGIYQVCCIKIDKAACHFKAYKDVFNI